jgi:hypothetical protein
MNWYLQGMYAGEITVINDRYRSAENPMSIHGVQLHDIKFDE